MRTPHAAVEMVTAFVSTLVAGMSLLLPIDFAWSSESTPLQLDMLAFSVPRAIAMGAIIAVLVAVFATTVNHALAAWGTALAGVVIMLINHLAGHGASPVAPLSTLNFVDSIAGGMLLGGIAAAVLRGRMQVFGWTLGALTSFVIAAALPAAHSANPYEPVPAHWSSVDYPPLWLIEVTLVLVAIGTLVNRRRSGIERRAFELPMAPIVAGVLYIGAALLGSQWLAGQNVNGTDIVLAVAITAVTATIAAMLLPRRDGTLVLLAVALSSVGSAIVPTQVPGWSAWILVALLALGILLGFRYPAPLLAMAALAVLAVAGALSSGDHGRLHVAAIGAALALIAGFSFGCAAPRYNPTRVLGVAIVLGSSVVLATRGRGEFGTAVIGGAHWSSAPAPMAQSAGAYWVALAITVCCALSLLALRHWRKVTGLPRQPVESEELPGDS
ncbi:hypothetical protein [Nocardia miyunensis]|uniref:hypothetical protein n=1 Tax=Nocardia miyunensis TaxID=282684 RepID=UPI00082CB9A7|nr:hypothetical protein [Nocardia miyunensis]